MHIKRLRTLIAESFFLAANVICPAMAFGQSAADAVSAGNYYQSIFAPDTSTLPLANTPLPNTPSPPPPDALPQGNQGTFGPIEWGEPEEINKDGCNIRSLTTEGDEVVISHGYKVVRFHLPSRGQEMVVHDSKAFDVDAKGKETRFKNKTLEGELVNHARYMANGSKDYFKNGGEADAGPGQKPRRFSVSLETYPYPYPLFTGGVFYGSGFGVDLGFGLGERSVNYNYYYNFWNNPRWNPPVKGNPPVRIGVGLKAARTQVTSGSSGGAKAPRPAATAARASAARSSGPSHGGGGHR